jgi:hypothetical protein
VCCIDAALKGRCSTPICGSVQHMRPQAIQQEEPRATFAVQPLISSTASMASGCVLTWVVALPDVANAPVGPQRAYAYDLASVRIVQPAAPWCGSNSRSASELWSTQLL